MRLGRPGCVHVYISVDSKHAYCWIGKPLQNLCMDMPPLLYFKLDSLVLVGTNWGEPV